MNKPITMILTAVAVLLLWNAVFVVDERNQALVVQLGRVVSVKQEPGLKLKIPFLQSVVYFDKRVLNIDMEPEEVIAGDDKRLIVDAYAKYKITDPLEFYRKVAIEANFIARARPILEASIRTEVGQVALQELLTDRRATVMNKIREKAGSELKKFGVTLVDVRIMRTDLPHENSEAIYRRMQTEHEKEARETRAQGAEEAQRVKAKADKDKEILIAEAVKNGNIIRGEAEAKATAIFASSSGKDPSFYSFYRSMQAYRKTLKKEDTKVVLSPDSAFLRYFRD